MPQDTHSTVDPGWIAAHLDDPRVRLIEIDVSDSAYDQGHIPGAVLWNAYTDLRDAAYRPVPPVDLQRLISRSGIAPETTAVVYGYAGPLGFWLMRLAGHRDVKILPGSREQWAAAGGNWTSDKPPQVVVPYPDLREDGGLLASREDVERAIRDPGSLLLDVRSPEEYRGERFWQSGATEDTGRAGHIPGAVNVPIDTLRREDGAPKSPERLQRVFRAAGVTRDRSIIAYCTIGNRASEAWFDLTHGLGYPDVRVYYESWVTWGRSVELPVAA